MTIPPTWIPKAYYTEINGKEIEVKKDKKITEPSIIARILEGPRSGEKIIISETGIKNNRIALKEQIADRVFEKYYKVEIIKKVKKGWIKVIERPEGQYAKKELLWTCVSESELKEKVKFRWNNYAEVFEKVPFFLYAVNTIIVCVLGVFGVVLSSALVAYGFAKIPWKGRDTFFMLTLATMMIPFPVVMIPLYSVFKHLHWIDTLKPLWLPYFFGSAFNIFLLRQFFMTIPNSLIDAARIDGCSEFEIFWKVILPLSKPVLAVVALFHFMFAWNDFMGPLIYLTNQENYTLSLGLQVFQSQHGGTEWHLLMAASTMVILPVLILFFFTQKTFIQGITLSGLKE
ncbi:MAG: carbohydrate ABC transporter permease [Elusimicrobia bacterium]|nr:carbohydrate ABC transporter permease [Elusimicrobiota bacterium]